MNKKIFLDPKQKCWWTNNKLTQLEINSKEILGAGISTTVLEDVFKLKIKWEDCLEDEYCRKAYYEKYTVHIHDNCFFSISPNTLDLLDMLLISILKVHNFYTHKHISLEVKEKIKRIILFHKQIYIKSKVSYLNISWKIPNTIPILRFIKPYHEGLELIKV